MPELLILSAAGCWAVGLLMLRGLTARVPPLQINGTRLLAPALAFPLIVLVSGRLGALPLTTLLAILGSAAAGIGAGDALLLAAVRRIGVARAYALASTHPLFTALMAVVFLGEALSAAALAGAFLVVGGAVLLAVGRAPGPDPLAEARRRLFVTCIGVGIALFTAALWALDVVLIRIALDGLEPTVVNAVRMPLAAVAVNLAALAYHRRPAAAGLDARGVVLALGSGLVATTLGSFLWLVGVEQLGAARSGALGATSPVFALILGVLFLRRTRVAGPPWACSWPPWAWRC